MTTAATIIGYLVIVAICVLVIGLVVAYVLAQINTMRTLQRDLAVNEYCLRIGNRLHGDADWFSEDLPTTKLLQSVALDLTRGVSMDPNMQREQWRKWRESAERKQRL